VKVHPELWYYRADKLGIIAQDWTNSKPPFERNKPITDQEAREGGARAVVLLGRQARNYCLAGLDQ